MRVPRDLSATELVVAARRYGYVVTRQKGSHLRLTSTMNGEHHITIPNHSALRLGTLNAIITDIATHFRHTKEEVCEKLFGS